MISHLLDVEYIFDVRCIAIGPFHRYDSALSIIKRPRLQSEIAMPVSYLRLRLFAFLALFPRRLLIYTRLRSAVILASSHLFIVVPDLIILGPTTKSNCSYTLCRLLPYSYLNFRMIFSFSELLNSVAYEY